MRQLEHWSTIIAFYKKYYCKYPNLVRTHAEKFFDPNYLVRILFER